ncbi:MAG: hypothetical protein DBY17_04740 [Oscillospiraceae bacterium]|nr:MAG: hypothetical protein DBY17_04740 [Oscillospiraceae bacterium]
MLCEGAALLPERRGRRKKLEKPVPVQASPMPAARLPLVPRGQNEQRSSGRSLKKQHNYNRKWFAFFR